MSSKVIKEDRSEGVFKMREFATVERGERDYNLRRRGIWRPRFGF